MSKNVEIYEEEKVDKTIENEKNVVSKFNIGAFLFCGTYYIFKGRYLTGIVLFALTVAIPMTYYFFVGLCCGFFTNVVKSRVSIMGIVLSIFSVILFVVLKLVRLYFTGGM